MRVGSWTHELEVKVKDVCLALVCSSLHVTFTMACDIHDVIDVVVHWDIKEAAVTAVAVATSSPSCSPGHSVVVSLTPMQ